jgi:hypothetical protein
MEASLYEELERVFDQFPKYYTKMMLRYFNAEVGREDIFKPTIGNKSLHKNRNENGVKSSKLWNIRKSYCQKYDVPITY